MGRAWYRVDLRLANVNGQDVVALVRVRASTKREAAAKAMRLMRPAALRVEKENPKPQPQLAETVVKERAK